MANFRKNFLFILILVFAIPAYGSNYEISKNKKASELLPTNILKGENYSIVENVIPVGYMNSYNVKSNFADFNVIGNFELYKLINEINAIVELNKIKKTDAFKDAVVKSAESPIKFAQNMIEDPVDTASGVPKGIFNMFGNIKTSLFSKKDSSEDSTIKELAKVSSCKRDYAKSVGVDVYSRNVELQKVLNSLGWACSFGDLSLSAATVPIGGTIVTAVKTTKLAQDVTNAIYSEPPSKLRRLNESRLKKIGLEESAIKQFLDHPLFTPTQDTIISIALESMKDTKGLGNLLNYINISTEDYVDAHLMTLMVVIVADYNNKVAKIKNIEEKDVFILTMDENGNYMIPIPVDYVIWTELIDIRTSELISSKKN